MVFPWSGCCDVRYTAFRTHSPARGLQKLRRLRIITPGARLPDRKPADRLYRRLIELHNEAFDAGRLDVAYHLLAASLHAAEEAGAV